MTYHNVTPLKDSTPPIKHQKFPDMPCNFVEGLIFLDEAMKFHSRRGTHTKNLQTKDTIIRKSYTIGANFSNGILNITNNILSCTTKKIHLCIHADAYNINPIQANLSARRLEEKATIQLKNISTQTSTRIITSCPY